MRKRSQSKRKPGGGSPPSSLTNGNSTPSGSGTSDTGRGHSLSSDGNEGDKRRGPTQEESALTSKNYRLAKELSELRVRHRDETKQVTKLTMENMNLASRCREAISHVAMLKKEISEYQRRSAELLTIQRQPSNGTSLHINPSGLRTTAPGEGAAEKDKNNFGKSILSLNQRNVLPELPQDNQDKPDLFASDDNPNQSTKNQSNNNTHNFSSNLFHSENDFSFISKSPKKFTQAPQPEEIEKRGFDEAFSDINELDFFHPHYKSPLPTTPEKVSNDDALLQQKNEMGILVETADSIDAFDASFDTTFLSAFKSPSEEPLPNSAFDVPHFPDPFFSSSPQNDGSSTSSSIGKINVTSSHTSQLRSKLGSDEANGSSLASKNDGTNKISNPSFASRINGQSIRETSLTDEKNKSRETKFGSRMAVDYESKEDDNSQFDPFPDSPLSTFDSFAAEENSNLSFQKDINKEESELGMFFNSKVSTKRGSSDQIGIKSQPSGPHGDKARSAPGRPRPDTVLTESSKIPAADVIVSVNSPSRVLRRLQHLTSKGKIGYALPENKDNENNFPGTINDEMRKLDAIANGSSSDSNSLEKVNPPISPLISSRRRNVKQPVSYTEPSIHSKLRRGDVFFPKKENTVSIQQQPDKEENTTKPLQ